MQNLLKNKPLLFGAIGVIVLILIIVIALAGNGNKDSANKAESEGKKKLPPTELELLKTDNLGKALEIQSILATEGIQAGKTSEGSKYTISLLKGTTVEQKDRALLTIVRSGIVDKNIGLEIFDKSDFMASKEDKRIRLLRATNGELSRLIKQLRPITDASVFISIPAQETIFTEDRKPVTATVQVTLPPSDENGEPVDRLDRDKIRTITNLLLGSVQGLSAKNISITDTNGNVYSSMINTGDDIMNQLEERDQYMKNKVMAQLDRLVGKGNYVVTVSTYLREAPLEASKIVYNPKQSSVISAQKFRESLGDKSSDMNKYSSATSTYIPAGLPSMGDSASDRNYARTAEEYQYGVGRMQVSETKAPGMIEEISVAVTLDRAAVPSGMTMKDLKELVARAASPKVNANDVKVVFSETGSPSFITGENPVQTPVEEGNPWWWIAGILGGILILGLIIIGVRSKYAALKQQEEIDRLNEKALQQENMIKEAHNRAMKLAEMQEKLQNTVAVPQVQPQPQVQPVIANLQETLADIKGNIIETTDEKELAKTLKTWIESAG